MSSIKSYLFPSLFKFFIISCVGAIITTSAYGVEGYKNLKFGISKQKVFNSGLCTFQNQNSGQAGVEAASCSNLKFGRSTVIAMAFFINNKFLRFALMPPIQDTGGLVNALKRKYGTASSSSSQAEFRRVTRKPNQEAFLAFDNNTIILKITSDNKLRQKIYLMYTSHDYETLLKKNQEKSVMGDL